MSLTAIERGIALLELDAWGSLTGLGGEILEGGDVRAFGRFTHGAPTDAISAGYFGTSKGSVAITSQMHRAAAPGPFRLRSAPTISRRAGTCATTARYIRQVGPALRT
ncbi:hypothetical protein OKW46_002101 [Paraburkholderia sp. WSM4179]|nr:hypothetical protein [Paraburkholderia sp. WSM4179]